MDASPRPPLVIPTVLCLVAPRPRLGLSRLEFFGGTCCSHLFGKLSGARSLGYVFFFLKDKYVWNRDRAPGPRGESAPTTPNKVWRYIEPSVTSETPALAKRV